MRRPSPPLPRRTWGLLPLRPVLIGELYRRCHGDAHRGFNGHGSVGMRCQDTLVALFRNSQNVEGWHGKGGWNPAFCRNAGAIFLDTRQTEVPPDAGCSSRLSHETVVQF